MALLAPTCPFVPFCFLASFTFSVSALTCKAFAWTARVIRENVSSSVVVSRHSTEADRAAPAALVVGCVMFFLASKSVMSTIDLICCPSSCQETGPTEGRPTSSNRPVDAPATEMA
jgi:hypothetical protein